MLAELVVINIQHVAITLHSTKDNHQFENEKFQNEIGCNWILNKNTINEDKMVSFLTNIIENKKEYNERLIKMENFSYQNSWNNINLKINSIINEN